MRCFVALVPAEALVESVSGWAKAAVAPLESVRPLEQGSLHVTLAFLGELDDHGVGAAGEIVASVEPRAVRMRLESGAVAVPRRRPRVLALDEAQGEVASLQAEVSEALTGAGVLESEGRPFWSHLSFARVKRGALDGKRGSAAIEALPPLSDAALEPHAASRLVLYRSELGPRHATYTALAEAPLPGDA